MKRSVGVVVSAVIAILGSLAQLFLGASLAFSWAAMRSNGYSIPPTPDLPTPPFDVATVLLVESIIFLGLGVLGIVCAISLLRLKNWARISFLIFAGILCFFSVMGIFGTLLMLFVMPQILPPQEGVPPGFLTGVFAVSIIVAAMLVALGVWWLIYFSRRKVKEQFLGEPQAAVPRRGPLSVTIIAWLLLVGGGITALALPLSYPAVLFGVAFRGWAGKAILALFGLASLLAGSGMLRWRAKAHSLAVAFYAFSLLNLVSYIAIPASFARLRDTMQEIAAQNASSQIFLTNPFIWFGVLMGLLGTGVPLCFLITRRKAFLEACEAPEMSIRGELR